jgi:hypothetical protein
MAEMAVCWAGSTAACRVECTAEMAVCRAGSTAVYRVACTAEMARTAAELEACRAVVAASGACVAWAACRGGAEVCSRQATGTLRHHRVTGILLHPHPHPHPHPHLLLLLRRRRHHQATGTPVGCIRRHLHQATGAPGVRARRYQEGSCCKTPTCWGRGEPGGRGWSGSSPWRHAASAVPACRSTRALAWLL